MDFINQCFQEQLMLGGYKCGWWKLVRDNDEKNVSFQMNLKTVFFLFFFCNLGEINQFFFKFSLHHPLFLSNEDSCSSRL